MTMRQTDPLILYFAFYKLNVLLLYNSACHVKRHASGASLVVNVHFMLKPIPPNPQRWKPNPDPANAVIPGLDTEASTTDQIEQIEQLITIKLQVGI